MKQSINAEWKGKMKFETELDGHNVVLDASPDTGGEDEGPRPKKLMLLALAGCTGMDVVSILKKMRVSFDSLNIEIEADSTEEHPMHYTKIKVIYKFKGEKIDKEKIKKAVDLSQNKYCGVSAVYKKALDLSYEILIEN